MSGILNQQLVLVLDKHWMPINQKTVKDGIVDLTSEPESHDRGRYQALDLDFSEEGELLNYRSVYWEEWLTLLVRPGDIPLQCARHLVIRCPTVIVTPNYKDSHKRKVPFSPLGIKKRDKFQCQYCKNFFPEEELNMDHVVPRSKGGPTNWENIACSCIPCNNRKKNRSNEQMGYELLTEPMAPAPLPSIYRIDQVKHDSWMPFLMRNKK